MDMRIKKTVKVTYDRNDPKEVYYPNSKLTYLDYGDGPTLDPEDNVDRLVAELTDIQETYGQDYENLNFVAEDSCYCYDSSCSCKPRYKLYGTRLETDTEYEYRINKKKLEEKEKERRELELYESLKKKFEK